MAINKAVLALRPLREAIGSEWRHKTLPGAGTVQLLGVDDFSLTVRLSQAVMGADHWPVLDFLRYFKAAIPKDQIPNWYQRLLEDNVI